jgi:GAF domain-containing protein
MIKRLFSPPQFEKREDNFRAKLINGFAWVAIILLAFALIAYIIKPSQDYTVYFLSGLIAVMCAALYLLHRGNIGTSGILIIGLGWLGLAAQAFTADGVKDVIVVGYLALGLMASIVIGWRAGGLVILTSIGAIWALALLELNGVITPHIQDPIGYSRDLSLIFVAVTVLVYFSTTSLQDAIRRAAESEKELLVSNRNLQELTQNLEERIANRTRELELVNQRNEKRAKQYEAVAEVARATTINESLETLLPRLVELISERFGFYHAGIFLLDENREFAVLSAANSAGGKRMLERGHKLKVGQTGIVGYITATGSPRIALDVGTDAVFFNNPDLPDTRSETALPLRSAGEVIGALDVQSTEPNAFQPEDIEVLATLADQVAIAIQNSRSYETMQRLIEEAQKVSGVYLRDTWRALQTQEKLLGYHASGNELKPLTEPVTSLPIRKALRTKKTVVDHGKTATLAIPIRLRDEVIGVMDIRIPDRHEWDPDEVDIAEAAAERLSLALETSMLLKSTQRRAEFERITADISGRIGATTHFDSILRAAAEELSRVLGDSEVLVQIQPGAFEQVKE